MCTLLNEKQMLLIPLLGKFSEHNPIIAAIKESTIIMLKIN